jgi:hypothetical protein
MTVIELEDTGTPKKKKFNQINEKKDVLVLNSLGVPGRIGCRTK